MVDASDIPDRDTIYDGRRFRRYLATGLKPGTGYRFRMIATNMHGIGWPSLPSGQVRSECLTYTGQVRVFNVHRSGQVRVFNVHRSGRVRVFNEHRSGQVRVFNEHRSGQVRVFNVHIQSKLSLAHTPVWAVCLGQKVSS